MGSDGGKPHGRLLAGEAGELAGVSGTTIGQWARWGYIRASQSAEDPHVYSVEDVAEAAIVQTLLERGVRHADIRRAVAALTEFGPWPLSEADLATTTGPGRALLLLRNGAGLAALVDRGWQRVVDPPPHEDVHLRLRRSE